MRIVIFCFFLATQLDCFCQVRVFPFKKDGLWGAVDDDLKEVIEPLYSKMNFFVNYESPQAMAIITDNMSGYKGLIDRKGEILLQLQYSDLTYTDDGNGIVLYQTYPDKKYGLYSVRERKIVTNPIYEESPSSFLEAEAFLVVKRDGNYGVIRSDGTSVVPLQYENVRLFSTERCPWISAEKENTVVYYNCKGTIRTKEPETSFKVSDLISIGGEGRNDDGVQISMEPVTQGLVSQKLGEKATILHQFQNRAGEHFAIVQVDNKKGMMDGKGVIRVPLEYDEIKNDHGFGGFIVVKNGLQGWIDITPGKVVIEPAFKRFYIPYKAFGRVKSAYDYVIGVTDYNNEAFIELKTGKVFYPKN